METYSLLREFADSWMMLFLFVFFVSVCIWVIFGKRSKYQDTAEMIFRNEDHPASDDPEEPKKEART